MHTRQFSRRPRVYVRTLGSSIFEIIMGITFGYLLFSKNTYIFRCRCTFLNILSLSIWYSKTCSPVIAVYLLPLHAHKGIVLPVFKLCTNHLVSALCSALFLTRLLRCIRFSTSIVIRMRSPSNSQPASNSIARHDALMCEGRECGQLFPHHLSLLLCPCIHIANANAPLFPSRMQCAH